MGINHFTNIDWEKDNTVPAAAKFRPVGEFLVYDPTPAPTTTAQRVHVQRRAFGATFDQLAQYLGWDVGTLKRYLNGTWPMPAASKEALERLLADSPNESTNWQG